MSQRIDEIVKQIVKRIVGKDLGINFVNGKKYSEIEDDVFQTLTSFATEIRESEREKILKQLETVEHVATDEKEAGWADHCTCLSYAINEIKLFQPHTKEGEV